MVQREGHRPSLFLCQSGAQGARGRAAILRCNDRIEQIYAAVVRRNPGEVEFHQAVKEVVETLGPVLERHPEYVEHKVIERICEPERQVIFRVSLARRRGEADCTRIPRGLQQRARPLQGRTAVPSFRSLGIVKFLGFEQIYQERANGACRSVAPRRRGLRPKGSSDGEIMRFCQSFMTTLCLTSANTPNWPACVHRVALARSATCSGSTSASQTAMNPACSRQEPAVGRGAGATEANRLRPVYFVEEMLKSRGTGIEGRTCTVVWLRQCRNPRHRELAAAGGEGWWPVRTLCGVIYDRARRGPAVAQADQGSRTPAHQWLCGASRQCALPRGGTHLGHPCESRCPVRRRMMLDHNDART